MTAIRAFRPSPSRSDSQLRHLSQSARLEETLTPALVRVTMIAIALSVLGFIVWASQANVYEIARSGGEVATLGRSQHVQHLEGGIVREILVADGQEVAAGQVLVRLDGATASAELEQALARETVLALQAERLRAFIDEREPDFSVAAAAPASLVADQAAAFESMVRARAEEREVLAEQLEQKRTALALLDSEIGTAEQDLAIIRDLHQRRSALSERGHVSEVRLLETAQELNDVSGQVAQLVVRRAAAAGGVAEFESRLRSLDARHRSTAHETLGGVEAELAQVRETVAQHRERVGRLEVRAPVRGIVKGLAVNTIGGVVGPGEVLAEIVPLEERLVVQLKIPPRHIGHIEIGQTVRMNFSSYDATRYGATLGTLEFVSATTFAGPDGERYYQGRVLLPNDHVGADPTALVMPGMTGTAHIVTGERTILDYLLQPVRASMQTALTER